MVLDPKRREQKKRRRAKIMAEVRVENLTKKYGRHPAVDNLSFSCPNGEFLSILGPSGAGKTTILELIAGIKKPDSGKIFIGNRLVNGLPPQDRDVAMAFETYSLYPHLSVYGNIAFPLRAPRRKEKLSREEERRKVEEMAEILGIGELLDRKPQHLSGGQKQRVSLARAMIRLPKVYLLDEPIAHLDAKLKASARTTLKRLARNLGTTIIYVTHDYREAMGLSDRILVLRKGSIAQIGTPDEIFFSPANDFVGRLVGDPPINLIDGVVTQKDGLPLFSAQGAFAIPIQKDLVSRMEKIMWQEGDQRKIRLGLRPQYVKLSKNRLSDSSFQLPVYAAEHTADSSIVTFELQETLLIAQIDKGSCDTEGLCWIELDQDHLYFFKKSLALVKK
jgi:ABC-type sugar transport system ATPase subunit